MTTSLSDDPPASHVGDALGSIVRARLVDRLDVAVRSPVTFLAAPVGSGKSSLVAQWSASRPDLPVVSIALRKEDDLSAVVRRLVESVASAVPLGRGARARLQNASRSAGPRGLAAVFAELSEAGPVVVVVDDLDAPSDSALVAEVAAALAVRRPSVHFVVGARSARAPCLAVMRRDVDAAEIGAAELAFTADEVRDAVAGAADVVLDEDQVAALLDRTEGWAVAVGVAGLVLRGAADVDAAIAAFSGRTPRIAAFIADEVLGPLGPVMREFLLRTSPLDPLVGAACDAVTGRSAGALMLRYLDQLGVPMDRPSSDSPVHRYRRLVREHLQDRLRLAGRDVEVDVLRRAARWHADHDDPVPAGRYLSAAEDWDGLVSLVDGHGQRWFERGEADRLAQWMDAVPAAEARRAPGDSLRLAYLHTMDGRTRRGAEVIRAAEAGGVDRATRLCFDALRAAWVFIDGTPEASGRAAERVLELLDQVGDDELPDVLGLTNRESLHTIAAGALAKGAWFLGDVGRGRQGLAELLARRQLYAPWRVHLQGAMALLHAWDGDLRVAEEQANAALSLARSEGIGQHPAIVDSLVALGHVRRERGELRRAMVPLHQANTIASRFRRPTVRAIHAVELAALSLASDVPDRGLEAIRSRWVDGEPPPPPLVERRLRAEAIRCYLALRQPAHARALLASDESAVEVELAPMRVALAISGGDLAEAERGLAEWPDGHASTRSRLDKGLWTAIVRMKAGHRVEALRIATETFALAEVEGHVGFIGDAGAPAADLLRAVLHGAPSAPARRLAARSRRRDTIIGLDLSDRELEVVRFLPTPLSNAEMAARLYISLNTLKTHLRAIYRKLGVTGRRDAIRRAQELGIA